MFSKPQETWIKGCFELGVFQNLPLQFEVGGWLNVNEYKSGVGGQRLVNVWIKNLVGT